MSQGTIETLKSGRVRVRFRIGPGKNNLKTVDTFDTVEDAERNRREMAEQLNTSERETEKDVTVAKLGDEALTQRELRGKISDPDSDWSRFRQHIEKARIGKMAVRTVAGNPTHVEEWLDELEAAGLSDSSVRHCKHVLSAIMKHAIKKRLIKSNPCIGGARRAATASSEEAWTYANADEQNALVRAAKDVLGVEEALIDFAQGSGLRAGEIACLHLSDVNLRDADPHLVVRYGKRAGGKLRPPKWGRTRRVQLFGRAKAALERWLVGLPTFCPANPHGLVFPRPGGNYRDNEHLIRWEAWKGRAEKKTTRRGKAVVVPAKRGILELAGITRDFRWHDLRHTCASSLVSGWWGRRWSLKEICEVLGHQSVTQTERYAHLGETAVKAAARETEAAYQALFHAVPRSESPSPDSPTISLERDTSLELATFGLGSLWSTEQFPSVALHVERAWNTATTLHAAGARGDSGMVLRLGRELAELVLSSPPVALAIRAATGGPHSLTAAIELADWVRSELAPLAVSAERSR